MTTASLCGDGNPDHPGAWQKIGVKKDDVLTQPTAKQILQNNVAHEAVCGKSTKLSSAN